MACWSFGIVDLCAFDRFDMMKIRINCCAILVAAAVLAVVMVVVLAIVFTG